MKSTLLTFIIFLSCINVGCAFFTSNQPVVKPPADKKFMCSRDVMRCSDGSWVGRSEPSCEFICPQKQP